MPKYAILEAPSALGHVRQHLGVERAPQVLLNAGLADGLAARHAGRVAAQGYSGIRDPGTGRAVTFLTRDGGPEGFWIHIDADVFDQSIMRAVDDPRPDGLAWGDVTVAVRIAIGSGRAAWHTSAAPGEASTAVTDSPRCRKCKAARPAPGLRAATTLGQGLYLCVP